MAMNKPADISTSPKWPLAVAALLALGLALVPAVVTDSFTLQVLLLAIMFGALGACWNLVGGFLADLLRPCRVRGRGRLYHLAAASPEAHAVAGHPAGRADQRGPGLAGGRADAAPVGHYFAMATIALLQIGLLLMINWDWAGGAVGLEAPIGDAAWMLLFRSKVPYYWIAVGLAFLTFCATYSWCIRRPASTGAPSTATRPPRAACVAADRYKMLAFVLSAMTGVWGGFFAMYVGFIDPESMFSLTMSVQLVLVTILGGVGTLLGPWLGAAVLLPLSEGTRVLGSSGLGLDLLIFGLAILLVTMFLPGGLITLRKRHGSAGR